MRWVARNIGWTNRVIKRGSSQPMRRYSSTTHSAIASSCPGSPGRTMPTRSMGSSSSNSLSFILSPPDGVGASISFLHFHRLTRNISPHKVALVAWGEAGTGGFPGAFAIQASVFGFGDLHQGLLGHGIQGVVIGFTAKNELHAGLLFIKDRIGLVHGHRPIAGDRLLRPIAQIGLVTGARRFSQL